MINGLHMATNRELEDPLSVAIRGDNANPRPVASPANRSWSAWSARPTSRPRNMPWPGR